MKLGISPLPSVLGEAPFGHQRGRVVSDATPKVTAFGVQNVPHREPAPFGAGPERRALASARVQDSETAAIIVIDTGKKYMERLSLFPLLQNLADVPAEIPERDFGSVLRRLLHLVRTGDNRERRFEHFNVAKLNNRSRSQWSDLGLVHSSFTCKSGVYCHAQRRRPELPTGRLPRQEFVAGLVKKALVLNVSGELAEAAALAQDIKNNYLLGEDLLFDACARLRCDELIADFGVLEGQGTPGSVLDQQAAITAQYAAQQRNRVGKAKAMCCEAFMERTRAFIEGDDEPDTGVMGVALRKTDLAYGTVRPYHSRGDHLVRFSCLYLRTRILVDQRGSSLGGIEYDFADMIDPAEEFDQPRLWADVFRTMASYFNRFGQKTEALECLTYLTLLVDHLAPVSIFTQTSVVERLIELARPSFSNMEPLIQIFAELLAKHRIRYFGKRFEFAFGPLENYVDPQVFQLDQPMRLASRSANVRFFQDWLQ